MSLSTRLKLCSEDRPIDGIVQREEAEPPRCQTSRLIAAPGIVSCLRGGESRVFTLLFSDNVNIIKRFAEERKHCRLQSQDVGLIK